MADLPFKGYKTYAGAGILALVAIFEIATTGKVSISDINNLALALLGTGLRSALDQVTKP